MSKVDTRHKVGGLNALMQVTIGWRKLGKDEEGRGVELRESGHEGSWENIGNAEGT